MKKENEPNLADLERGELPRTNTKKLTTTEKKLSVDVEIETEAGVTF